MVRVGQKPPSRLQRIRKSALALVNISVTPFSLLIVACVAEETPFALLWNTRPPAASTLPGSLVTSSKLQESISTYQPSSPAWSTHSSRPSCDPSAPSKARPAPEGAWPPIASQCWRVLGWKWRVRCGSAARSVVSARGQWPRSGCSAAWLAPSGRAARRFGALWRR